MATTAFGALNTVIIGAFMLVSDVAFWSVCMQIIGAIQTMYNPITNGVYPNMVRTKDLGLIKKILIIVMPIILLGCVVVFLSAPLALQIAFGSQYRQAYPILRILIPVLIFSFPGMLLGWPTLGALGKKKQVTISTIITAVFQVLGLFFLLEFGLLGLISVAILRGLSEFVLLLCRFLFFERYRLSIKQ